LRQQKGKGDAAANIKPDQRTQCKDDSRLQDHQTDKQTHNCQGLSEQNIEVDLSTNGNEEQPQQQALERLNVAFQLMPVFAIGQNHTCDECTKRGGKTNRPHQERNAHNDQQRHSREQLSDPCPGYSAEHRAEQVATANDDSGNNRNGHHRLPPGR